MYGIDKEVDGFHNLTVKTPDKSFTDVDAIVIAVIKWCYRDKKYAKHKV